MKTDVWNEIRIDKKNIIFVNEMNLWGIDTLTGKKKHQICWLLIHTVQPILFIVGNIAWCWKKKFFFFSEKGVFTLSNIFKENR